MYYPSFLYLYRPLTYSIPAVQAANISGGADSLPGSRFVVFSMDYLHQMGYTIWSNVGSIFSMAFYAFIMVLSVHLVFNIVSDIGR